MKEVDRYRKEGGINLLLDININSNSIVMDVGAFTGNFSKQLMKKFNCNLIAVEPISKYFKSLKNNLKEYDKAKVFNLGIGSENTAVTISIDGDRSSLHIKGKENETCVIREFFDFIHEIQLKKIDLFIINVEGAEYEILDHILKNRKHLLIDNFIIQFHNFGETKIKNRDTIRRLLKNNYEEVFCYKYVWEKWKKK